MIICWFCVKIVCKNGSSDQERFESKLGHQINTIAWGFLKEKNLYNIILNS